MYPPSLWQQTAVLPGFSPLQGDTRAAVAIVGGGLCGLLTAYHLHKAGVNDIAVLEANTLCGGTTARTTAKISALQGPLFGSLIQNEGLDAARRYAALCSQAVADYRALAPRLAPDCDLAVCSSVLYARNEEEARQLAAEHRAMEQAGLAPYLSRDTELPFAVTESLWLPEQAAFHPLRFAAGLIRHLSEAGVRFYEHTPVLYPASANGVLHTEKGRLQTDTVILTAHYPLSDRRGLYFTRLYQKRGYIVAFENAPRLRHLYRGMTPGSWSLRSWQDRLLVGFGSHPTGEEAGLPHIPLAQATVTQWYPGCTVSAAWGNQDLATPDGLPYVGLYPAAMPRLAPKVLLAAGFNGWGMVGSMVAAGALSRLLTEQPRPEDAILSPRRPRSAAYAAVWLKENGRVLASLAGGWLTVPPRAVHLLPPGEGGLFRINGHRVGVYKDETGQLHTVRPVCPHLGCMLRWNREEKSWDCPCHGSRFDVHGRVLNTPAPKDLKKQDHFG